MCKKGMECIRFFQYILEEFSRSFQNKGIRGKLIELDLFMAKTGKEVICKKFVAGWHASFL
jgi:hypothetical protein